MVPQRPGSAKRVLPPISSENEKHFLQQLEETLTSELAYLKGQKLDEQKYAVFKNSFNQIIDHVSAYKPLLTAIKAEYEACIDTIQRGQKEAFFLSGKVKAMAAEQNTLTLYQKRSEELDQRVALIKADNERLEIKLQEIQEVIDKRQRTQEILGEQAQTKVQHPMPNKCIPGLTLEQSLDVNRLKMEVQRLEQVITDIEDGKSKRYRPRKDKNELKQQLAAKSTTKEHVNDQNRHLKARSLKLRVALEALKTNFKDKQEDLTPAEAVTLALTRSASKMSFRSQETASNFDDDDPTKEREAELLLDYIDQFNNLFDENRYAEAAMHAANSPKGILRNPETLARFKAIHVKAGQASPLLMYCESLVASVPAVGSLPDAETSLECVKGALMEDRIDLVTHWLAQNRLTLSEPVGHLLYNYTLTRPQETVLQCLPLAQAVYTRVGAHIQAAVCMCKQGKVHAMVEYAQATNLSKAAYVGVLVACPSLALACVLVNQRSSTQLPILSVGQVVSTLLKTENHQVGLELIELVHAHPKPDDSLGTLKGNVFNDRETSPETWLHIIKSCQDGGLYDAGLELLAALTVQETFKKAVGDLQNIYV